MHYWLGIAALLFPLNCFADLAVQVIRPGLGRFGELNYSEVSKDGNRFLVRHHLEPGGTYPPRFDITWSNGTWSVFSLSPKSTGAEWIDFAPFGNEGGFGGISLSQVVLPPDVSSAAYGLSFSPEDGGSCIPNCVHRDQFIEFSLVEIDEPLTGDFDINNRVDFADFLTLSRNFGDKLGGFGDGGLFKSWNDGDANLDGVIDIEDFKLLSQNYGVTRVTPAATSVPEPFTGSMLALAFAGLTCCRLRKRHRT